MTTKTNNSNIVFFYCGRIPKSLANPSLKLNSHFP